MASEFFDERNNFRHDSNPTEGGCRGKGLAEGNQVCELLSPSVASLLITFHPRCVDDRDYQRLDSPLPASGSRLKAIAWLGEKGRDLISQEQRIEYARLGLSPSNMKGQRRLEVDRAGGRRGGEEGKASSRKGFSRRLASQSPSLDWCFHPSGGHTITVIRNASPPQLVVV